MRAMCTRRVVKKRNPTLCREEKEEGKGQGRKLKCL